MEILAVARGDRSNFPGYTDILPHEYRSVCGKVKFQAKGYVNLSLVGIMCAIFLPMLVSVFRFIRFVVSRIWKRK
jgi:hypothetical protein